MTRAIPHQAVTLVRDHEGYRSEAYKCPADVWTLGYGHTLAIREGQHCTLRQALLWLTEDLTRAGKAIERKVGPDVVGDLTDNQYAALLSFVFNLGTGNPTKPEWELWRRLRARDYDAVPAQLQRFCYADGKKLAGLVKRRADEIAVWNTGEPGLSHDEVHSAVTRLVDTPPAPSVKPANSPLVASVMGCVTMCGVAAKTISDAIQPFAEQSPIVGQALAVLATLGAVVAVVTVGLVWLQRQHART